MDSVQKVVQQARDELQSVATEDALEQWRVAYLGRSGRMTGLMRTIGKLPKNERAEAGRVLNESLDELKGALADRKQTMEEKAGRRGASETALDVTLPGVDIPRGAPHPIRTMLKDMQSTFQAMGFAVAYGPEVETDENNFELLNMPKDHPARDMWDTFYTKSGHVLRTHTSPVQIRVMRDRSPAPVKIICPGRVYRYEQTTARAESMFHQVEGLEVGPHVTMRDLLGILKAFVGHMFGVNREIRVRNSFFPFTEPSIEVDVSCLICEGDGCRICKQTGWVEILGAGMVHPVVLRNGGYDPEKVSGYAFGVGVERIVMLRYGVDDIRHFFRNDMRFLRQFATM